MSKTRDYTQAQFDARLKKNQFRFDPYSPFGVYFADVSIEPRGGLHIPGVFDWGGKMDRRATLAHLIQEREKCRARAAG